MSASNQALKARARGAQSKRTRDRRKNRIAIFTVQTRDGFVKWLVDSPGFWITVFVLIGLFAAAFVVSDLTFSCHDAAQRRRPAALVPILRGVLHMPFEVCAKLSDTTPPWFLLTGLAAGPPVLLTWYWRDKKRREDHRLAIESSVARRYTEATKLLASKDAMTRINGLFSLWDVARESPTHRATVARTLASFVQVRSQRTVTRSKKQTAVLATELTATVPDCEIESDAGALESLKDTVQPDVQAAALLVTDKKVWASRSWLDDGVRLRLNLREACLIGAQLPQANLSGADLSGADLNGANLGGADLGSANLYRAHLRGAILTDANLEGALLHNANLNRAKLTDANLTDVNLIGANLEGANLQRANLAEANLMDANLTDANLEGANLQGAFLLRTNMNYAHIAHADLRGAFLLTDQLEITPGDFYDACLLGVTYAPKAEFPALFVPAEHGMVRPDAPNAPPVPDKFLAKRGDYPGDQ